MVQPIDLNMIAMRPVYNAVNIKIRKPEVNAADGKKEQEETSCVTDTGIYNAVKIDIDRPAINREPKQIPPMIYDYPEAQGVVTYDMAGIRPVELPVMEYHTAALVVQDEDVPKEEAVPDDNKEEAVVPEPNYTTLDAEKELKASDTEVEKKNNDIVFHGLAFKAGEIKKPEIIPGEEIKPDVDIARVVSNLSGEDFDAQALQMEEIVRVSMEDKKNAIPYIVKDVYKNLIEITNKDTSKMEPPSEEQMIARQKLIADFITVQKNPETKEIPFKLSEEEIKLASKLTPMEQAERNKEYALYTMAVLSKVYVDEIKEETGNVVPMTDVPGMSATVDALRHSPNAGVKIAALEALKYQQRDEYKDELNAIYSIAATDKNPQVAMAAQNIMSAK